MKNFPAWREPVNSICVIALLKCIGSVGGVLSVQLYLAFIAPDQTAYVLFLAVGALVIFLPGAPLQRFFPEPERAEPSVELRRFAVAFGAVVLVIIASIGNAYLSDGLSHSVRAVFAAIILVLFSVSFQRWGSALHKPFPRVSCATMGQCASLLCISAESHSRGASGDRPVVGLRYVLHSQGGCCGAGPCAGRALARERRQRLHCAGR